MHAEQNSSLHDGHSTAQSALAVSVLLGVIAVAVTADVEADDAEDVDVEGAASDCEDVEPIRQTVSHPARGHHVRVLSNSISMQK